jgi:hypothetical protein
MVAKRQRKEQENQQEDTEHKKYPCTGPVTDLEYATYDNLHRS